MSGKIYDICFVFFFHFRLTSSLPRALSLSHFLSFALIDASLTACMQFLVQDSSFACRKLLVLSPKTLDEYSNVSPFNLTGACGDDLLDDGF